jgi:DNA-directed RNA polymerase specialized sigma24 family protein
MRRPAPGGAAEFPDTRTSLLERAAVGDWGPFLEEYLAPCWREIVIRCRAQHIPLGDADDLFQELIVRVIREGELRSLPADPGADGARAPVFRANIPGRYLQYRRVALSSARFRTVLKSVIQNVILETLRAKARLPQPLSGDVVDPAPRVEESVSDSVERHWMGACLDAAARRLHEESREAKTKGARRLFDVLYRSLVKSDPPGLIAGEYGVDRTTIAGLLTRARGRFIALLGEISGVNDVQDLKSIVSRMPDRLIEALEAAHGGVA